MVTNNFKLKRANNWLKGMTITSLLILGMGCSDEEIMVDEDALLPKETATLSNKVGDTFQAEDYDDEEGIQVVGGWRVGYIEDGDYLVFEDFDHSGATAVKAMASSGSNGGTIQFRKGSATGGDLLAEVAVSNTGGWSTMSEFSANITGSSSNSDLYVVFKGDSGYLLDIDSFVFTSSNTNDNDRDTTNLARNGTAEQSSIDWGGVPERAIDGDTNGIWKGDSVIHTDNEYQPWWQVRLDSNTNIEEIVIWNRTDACCKSRLSNFDVFVYNSSGSLVYKETVVDVPNPSKVINTGGVTGNRVRVKLKGTSSLQLAEVQVFGSSSNNDNDNDDDDDDSVDPPTGGDTPYEVLGLDRWKITLPKDQSGNGKADEVYYYKSDNDYS